MILKHNYYVELLKSLSNNSHNIKLLCLVFQDVIGVVKRV